MNSPRRLVPALAVVFVLAACGGHAPPAASAPSTSTATTTAELTTSTSPVGSTTSSGKASSGEASSGEASPPAGAAVPGEGLSADDVAELQQSVDEGHQPWRLDPAMVAEAYARSSLGWDDVDVAMTDPHTAEVTNRADGRSVTLQLAQPAREGQGGIWVVTGGTYAG